MIENKIVLDWAKKQVESINYYLEHDWNYAFDVDYDNQYEYEKLCLRLGELREKLLHAREFLEDEINDYESYLADMEMDVDLW